MPTRARQSACALGGGEQKQFCSPKSRLTFHRQTSSLTFNPNNPNITPLTNANFTDILTGMSVASANIGGSCARLLKADGWKKAHKQGGYVQFKHAH